MKKSVTINFADNVIVITANTEKIISQLDKDLDSFKTTDTAKNPIRIHIKALKKRKNYKPISNLEENTGKILLPNNEYFSFSELYFNLKIILAQLLITKNMLLLHASGFLKDEKMSIMSAPSGTGKSTTCRIARENGCTVVCDDSVLLKIEGNQVYAYTTPYIETHKKKLSPNKYDINGIYFLEQSLQDTSTKLSSIEATRTILFNSYIFQNKNSEQYIKKYFAVAHKIAELVSTYNLKFTKSNKFLQII